RSPHWKTIFAARGILLGCGRTTGYKRRVMERRVGTSAEYREGWGMKCTRRKALAGLGLAGVEALMPPLVKKAGDSSLMASLGETGMDARSCPFRLAVINDEITQDFEKACEIVSVEFGLQWIELRSMWNKNVTALNEKELEDARKILAEHKLRVTDIA